MSRNPFETHEPDWPSDEEDDADPAATIAQLYELDEEEVEEADPGATIADHAAHAALGAQETLPTVDLALGRIHSALGVPQAALNAARDQDPNATVDDILGALFDRAVLDKRQFILAHTITELDVSDHVELEAQASRYLPLGFFDEGGVGEIFIARDQVLRRKVAVKRIKPKKSTSDLTQRRFLREAQITAQLDHPNIVPIYSYEEPGEEHDTSSYAMKLIRGSTMAALIEQQRDAVASGQEDSVEALSSRLDLFVKVCDAMAYAHSRRVIHRDLKPENIMVGEFGEVYVMDWGLARLLDGPGSDAVRAAGTPYYMSPEQARGRPESLDPRSDIYTLGLILYELCTLQRALPEGSIIDVLTHAIDANTKPFRHISGQRLSPDLEAIFAHATQPRIGARYKTATELADDVRRYLRGEELGVRPDNLARKITRWIAQHRQLTLVVVLGLTLALALAIIWSLYQQKVTIEAAQHREERLTSWQADVAWHAAELERRLLRIELLTQHLGRSATTMLAHPSDVIGPVFDHDAIEAGETQPPPDFAWADSHQMKASFADVIFDRPPGVTRADVERDLRRLYPMRRTLQRVFLDYRDRQSKTLDDTTLQSMRHELVPLRWAYVALENGLYIGYPGTLGLPESYDSRKRPWYSRAMSGQGEVVWGTPYYGVQAGMLGLPALMAIYDDAGRTAGVVAVEVQVERLVESMLKRTVAGDVAMSLVDAEGRVVTTSGHDVVTQDATRSDALQLEPYPYPELLEAIQVRRSGHVEIDLGDETRFIGFQRLPTLGWYYVEEISGSELLGD